MEGKEYAVGQYSLGCLSYHTSIPTPTKEKNLKSTSRVIRDKEGMHIRTLSHYKLSEYREPVRSAYASHTFHNPRGAAGATEPVLSAYSGERGVYGNWKPLRDE